MVFITTYDLASQVVARRIGDTIRTFRPRSNAVAVILEAPSYAPLLPAYAAAMNLPYPIAMIDHDSYQGGGSFRGIDHVPTVVLLDRHGRETWRTSGEVTGLELKRALRQALESGSP